MKYEVSGFSSESNNPDITIIKPHGSINFIQKVPPAPTYGINYNVDRPPLTLDQLEIKMDQSLVNGESVIIPPGGDSQRLKETSPWCYELRMEAEKAAKQIDNNDSIILCGISYWHVDRKELDELLISLPHNAEITFVNPNPPRDLNAVLSSIFKNYVQFNSALDIGDMLDD